MKKFFQIITVLSIIMISSSCNNAQKLSNSTEANQPLEEVEKMAVVDYPETVEKVEKTPEEWRAQLGAHAYNVLREAGTERAFTGDYWDNKKEGVYTCRACNLPLFSSDTKFKSGTGWPSFYQPIIKEYVGENVDRAYGMTRTEVVCARCDGHLGHVFDDGPNPTGLRYCINGVSLNFVEK